MPSEKLLTRRAAMGLGAAGAATLVGVTASVGSSSAEQKTERMTNDVKNTSATGRLPVVFLPHGGGPWPFVDVGMSKKDVDALTSYLQGVKRVPTATPKALLVVSAHWEERVPTVMTSEKPPMLYDYYGFPKEAYELTWPAPGDPKLAKRVRELLGKAGIESAEDSKRGFDHGTFVPLKLTYPEAEIPTVQLSLKAGLNPKEHLAIGRALAPLRDEGVFIVGSGMTFHNLRAFRDPSAPAVAKEFDAWLRDATTREAAERDRLLADWAKAPSARAAHPREEHLIPLMIVAGAAGPDRATIPYEGEFWGIRLSGYQFG